MSCRLEKVESTWHEQCRLLYCLIIPIQTMVLYQFVEQIYIHFRQTKWSIGFGVWRKNYGYLLWCLNSQVITEPEHDSRLYCIDHMGSNGPSFSWFWSKIVSKLFLTPTASSALSFLFCLSSLFCPFLLHSSASYPSPGVVVAFFSHLSSSQQSLQKR